MGIYCSVCHGTKIVPASAVPRVMVCCTNCDGYGVTDEGRLILANPPWGIRVLFEQVRRAARAQVCGPLLP